jgi:hypothetical protein
MTVQSPPPAPKKGMGPLAWVGIGCGALVLIGVVVMFAIGYMAKRQLDKFEDNPAMAAATLAVKLNPDLELVDSDAEKNTLTVKDKKTGKVVTLSAEDIKEGKFTVTTDEGTTTLDMDAKGEDGGAMTVTNEKGEVATFSSGGDAPKNLPAWVPTYPGGTATGSYDATANNERSAAFGVTTTDSVDDVLAFYEEKLKGQGLEVQKTTFDSNGQKGGSVTGTTSDQKRTVSILVGSSDEGTQATVTFTEKK